MQVVRSPVAVASIVILTRNPKFTDLVFVDRVHLLLGDIVVSWGPRGCIAGRLPRGDGRRCRLRSAVHLLWRQMLVAGGEQGIKVSIILQGKDGLGFQP